MRSRYIVAVLAAVLAAFASIAPAQQASASPKAKELIAELQKIGSEVASLMQAPRKAADSAYRQERSAEMLPKLRRASELLIELNAELPTDQRLGLIKVRANYVTMAALLGDEASERWLKERTASINPTIAAIGQGNLLMLAWWRAGDDAAKREAALAEIEKYVLANPTSPMSYEMLETAASDAKEAELKRVAGAVAKLPPSEQSQVLQMQFDGTLKQLSMLGKPLAITGTKPDGQAFSTEQWKGKVVLVDFWATWCPPCIAGLPELEALYAKYHPQGLEIVGVSSDRDLAKLKQFMQLRSATMPWTQLYNPQTQRFNPDASALGVWALPTMFLIDRQGVLREVRAIGQLDTLIPKLLAEK